MRALSKIETSYPPTAAQRQEISDAFDRLPIGQALELVISSSSGAPGLLTEFQDRYGQNFDWWPLEQNAYTFRVLILRRAADEPRTIADFLGADHHRLAELWKEILETVQTCEQSHETLRTVERCHLEAPKEGLSQFIFGLRRHIRMEQDLLFPLLEERSVTPRGAGPTAVMRVEHRQIEAVLEALEKYHTAETCATIIQTIESQPVHPSALFTSHDAKEENVLYPLADRALPAHEVHKLIRAMQAS